MQPGCYHDRDSYHHVYWQPVVALETSISEMWIILTESETRSVLGPGRDTLKKNEALSDELDLSTRDVPDPEDWEQKPGLQPAGAGWRLHDELSPEQWEYPQAEDWQLRQATQSDLSDHHTRLPS